ncbi:MAG TPA: hypothetical protein DDW76_15920 [Cyanobacteria bacterium UBA11369]|nr:hypothetical protein [Cyanobacteria bacterium UBA11371]HBE33107.1 hypothetical protein [Cyanobacteria bacterium UBA11368]HBE50237.1 hypothetical protein [Cyanobacteria bacterium UBA11369]
MESRAIDVENFLERHPLNFLLFYGDYEVINTVYLDDGSPLVDLSVELFNQSTQKIVKFNQPNVSSASANNCHFYLTLEGIFILEKAPDGWDIAVEQSKSYTGSNFYFLKKEGCNLGSNNKIVLTLKKFRAAPEGGTRTLRAELTYGALLTDQNNKVFQDDYGQYSSYGNTIFITNNRGGKKTLPLQVDFATGNAVLNDGTATNSLDLLIANKNWPQNNLSISQDSQFVISFEMGDKEGSVATDTQVKAIAITSQSNKWDVQHVANSTEWTVKPKQGTNQLASNEAIKLNITNLVTSHSSGAGYLYVRYKNIPNYPDGQLVVPIEKTPLLYRAGQVGIGTTTPAKQLHVVGDLVLGKNDANKKFIFHSRTGNTENNDFLQITSDNSQGNWVWEQGITLKRNGDVGIGTKTPNDKLEVSGNIKATGAIKPSAGNNENFGIMFPKDPGGGGDDAAWIRYYARSGEACTLEIGISNDADDHIALMPQNGYVGIGTNTPSATLHVNGRIKDKTGWVMPVGTILPYAGATAPEGWLLCQGQELDKTQENNKYKDLFDVIAHRYTQNGSGNKFKLPNLQGRVPVGFSNEGEFNSLGKTGGNKTHTLTVNEMPSHNHGVNDPGHNHQINPGDSGGQGRCDDASGGGRSATWTERANTGISIQYTGGGQAHNNLQPYITVNYIIKY